MVKSDSGGVPAVLGVIVICLFLAMVFIPMIGYLKMSNEFYNQVDEAANGRGAVGITFQTVSDFLPDQQAAMEALVSNGLSCALLTYVRPIVQLVMMGLGAMLMKPG